MPKTLHGLSAVLSISHEAADRVLWCSTSLVTLQVEEIEWEPKKVDFIRSYVATPKLKEEAVRQAAELINNAKRPLALVGQGVELGHAQEELKTFLEKADIPAGRTMLGLSALPSDHPLNVEHAGYAWQLCRQLEGTGV